jgi:hypothetical protein
MGRRAAALVVLALVGLLAAVAGGCGSGSSTASSSQVTNGSKEFLGKGGKSNKYVKFGQESDVGEREEVSKLVEESFDAREARDWSGQCATLAKPVIKEMEENPGSLGVKGCAKALGTQGKNAPASTLNNNMAGPVGAFRVKATTGYALYHGTDKKDYAVSMKKEGGGWKVNSLLAKEIPGS